MGFCLRRGELLGQLRERCRVCRCRGLGAVSGLFGTDVIAVGSALDRQWVKSDFCRPLKPVRTISVLPLSSVITVLPPIAWAWLKAEVVS